MIEFRKYLLDRYLNWQQTNGKRKSLKDFADYLGVSRPLVSLWMNGTRQPSKESLEIISVVLGPEIFDALGLERPDIRLILVNKEWESLPEDARNRISEVMAEYKTGRKKDERDRGAG